MHVLEMWWREERMVRNMLVAGYWEILATNPLIRSISNSHTIKDEYHVVYCAHVMFNIPSVMCDWIVCSSFGKQKQLTIPTYDECARHILFPHLNLTLDAYEHTFCLHTRNVSVTIFAEWWAYASASVKSPLFIVAHDFCTHVNIYNPHTFIFCCEKTRIVYHL